MYGACIPHIERSLKIHVIGMKHPFHADRIGLEECINIIKETVGKEKDEL